MTNKKWFYGLAGLADGWKLSRFSYDSRYQLNSGSNAWKGAFESVWFKDDGTRFWVSGNDQNDAGNPYIAQYDCSTPWDITTATYDTKYDVGMQVTGECCQVYINPTGSQMLVGDQQNSIIYEYNLGTNFDIDTASISGSESFIAAMSSYMNGFNLKSDGSVVYFVDQQDDAIWERSLSTPYDIDSVTGSPYEVLDLNTATGGNAPSPHALAIKSNGKKVFVVTDYSNGIIHEFSLSTPWDFSTAVSTGSELDVSGFADWGALAGMYVSPNGKNMFVLGGGSPGNDSYLYRLKG